MCNCHGRRSHVVIARKDRGRTVGQIEQCSRRTKARTIGKLPLHNQFIECRQSRILHCLSKSEQSLFAGPVRQITDYKSYALVTERDDVSRHRSGGRPIIDADHRHTTGGTAVRHNDRKDIRLRQNFKYSR